MLGTPTNKGIGTYVSNRERTNELPLVTSRDFKKRHVERGETMGEYT